MDAEAEHRLVLQALATLLVEDPSWEYTYRIFAGQSYEQRYRWWELCKRQAKLGAEGPQKLFVEFTRLRMTE